MAGASLRSATHPQPLPLRGGEFAQSAARLAGLAGVAFGWSPDAFWRATPAELAGLVRAVAGRADPADGGVLARLKERFPDG